MYLNHYYNKDLQKYARELRKNTQSRGEKFIWKAIISKKQTGYRYPPLRWICNPAVF